MVHKLKTWPEHFRAVMDGTKTAELRLDDRGFQVGDRLRLEEWNPRRGEHTGHWFAVTVTHVLRGGPWLAPGCVMLSFRSESILQDKE